jgi:hypothetical protein
MSAAPSSLRAATPALLNEAVTLGRSDSQPAWLDPATYQLVPAGRSYPTKTSGRCGRTSSSMLAKLLWLSSSERDGPGQRRASGQSELRLGVVVAIPWWVEAPVVGIQLGPVAPFFVGLIDQREHLIVELHMERPNGDVSVGSTG